MLSQSPPHRAMLSLSHISVCPTKEVVASEGWGHRLPPSVLVHPTTTLSMFMS